MRHEGETLGLRAVVAPEAPIPRKGKKVIKFKPLELRTHLGIRRAVVEDFSPDASVCYGARVETKSRGLHRIAALALMAIGGSLGTASCASTEYFVEPPGEAAGQGGKAVPSGMIGVCKRADTKRPPVVSEALWEHARPCTPRTPPEHLRLGYSEKDDPEVEKQNETILNGLKEGQKEDGGNVAMLATVRGVRQRAVDLPTLRDRVSRDTTTGGSCDFTYLLNTMSKAREKIEHDSCSAEVYDVVEQKQVCLFDSGKPDATWLTSGWACLMNVRALGSDQSCHRLCAYDDYCMKQVSCAGADVDLLLCAMGICLPQQRGNY